MYLRSIYIKSDLSREKRFPLNLPLVRNLGEIDLERPVTFFVGENGSGKSTLLEAIASGLNAAAVGSTNIGIDASLESARLLSEHLRLVKGRAAKSRLFFRAEDFFGFVKRVIRDKQDLESMIDEYENTLSGLGKDLAIGSARGQQEAYNQRYGDDPDAYSHGESFLNLFQSRVVPGGLYLLDEPETPLSPLRQLAFLSLLKDMTGKACQFIIATHSPILMAFPDAVIYSFDTLPPRAVAYDDVEHVSLTRAFLQNPEAFLRRL